MTVLLTERGRLRWSEARSFGVTPPPERISGDLSLGGGQRYVGEDGVTFGSALE